MDGPYSIHLHPIQLHHCTLYVIDALEFGLPSIRSQIALPRIIIFHISIGLSAQYERMSLEISEMCEICVEIDLLNCNTGSVQISRLFLLQKLKLERRTLAILKSELKNVGVTHTRLSPVADPWQILTQSAVLLVKPVSLLEIERLLVVTANV